MTFSQKIVYDSILKYFRMYHKSPSIRNICRISGFSSPATIHKHLHNLEKLGYIELTGKKRGIILK